MKTYRATQISKLATTVVTDAADEQEAIEKFLEGDYEPIESTPLDLSEDEEETFQEIIEVEPEE
jgi:hypothetical protein